MTDKERIAQLEQRIEAADKLAEAAGRIATTMSDLLAACDAIRGLSALGRDSIEGEVIAVRAAMSAYEGGKE